MRKFVNRNSLLLFFIMAYAISWIGIVLSFGQVGLHIFQGENVLTGEFPTQLILIWLSMLAGPAISAILVTAITDGSQGLKHLLRSTVNWSTHIKWYGVAILLFPATLLLIFFSLSFVSVKYYPSSLLMPGLLVGLIGGFFEEIGWTGFALPKLLSRFDFIKTAIILGLIHSFWHLFADYLGSVDFYKKLYFFHFFLWTIALTALRFFIIWIYEHTGSVLLAILTHASFTGSQLILTPPHLNSRETILWYSIFVVVLTMLVLLIIKTDLKSMFFYSKRITT
jgi:membrane protease YdiL (CAAX protease family)